MNAPRSQALRSGATEVKKLQRSSSGGIARPSGLDFNTTPPCGTVRIYDASNNPLEVRGFYLFVCMETGGDGEYVLSALAFCDGNILNEDFELYDAITGQRQKEIGLGTYGDGVNRNRPMLIFSNPLGATDLDRAASLVTEVNLEDEEPRVGLVLTITRETPNGDPRHFFVYRKVQDIPPGWQVRHLFEPFPVPQTRNTATQARGKFHLPIRILG